MCNYAFIGIHIPSFIYFESSCIFMNRNNINDYNNDSKICWDLSEYLSEAKPRLLHRNNYCFR